MKTTKMKILILILRLFVAVTFIFSGFVKLVDPLGSAYKFEEYFGYDVLNMEFLIPYALPFSIFLILTEIMLGVMLLVGYLPKFTVSSLMGIIIVFLFLTWYSAYYNKVTDCGCFGDALKLSSWQTFYKNIVLVIAILLLFLKHRFIKPLFSEHLAKWSSFLSFFTFLFITYYVLVHLPIIDFRPYAIGKNISEGMKYIGDEEPAIHDFLLETLEGVDLTENLLTKDNVLLVIAYNLSKADRQGFSNIKKITDNAIKKNYTVYLVTSSLSKEFETIKKQHNLNIDMLFCDGTTLKTIIRANPGIVRLKNGTVVGKWSWVDIDSIKL